MMVFYIIYKGLKIFIRAFTKENTNTSFGKRGQTRKDKRNIIDAEFTEIESKIHTREEEKANGEG